MAPRRTHKRLSKDTKLTAMGLPGNRSPRAYLNALQARKEWQKPGGKGHAKHLALNKKYDNTLRALCGTPSRANPCVRQVLAARQIAREELRKKRAREFNDNYPITPNRRILN
jgi:hypothetical protein